MRIILRVIINAIALWAAATLIGGITLSDNLGSVLVVAIIFGLVNAVLRPIARLISFPLLILTLGLFTMVVNALMLQITDALSDAINVDGFWTSIFGAVVIGLVSWMLSIFVPDPD